MKFLKEERGSLPDILFILAGFLGVLITMLVCWTILNNVGTTHTELNLDPINQGKKAIEIFDSSMIFIFIALFAVAVILASQIRTNPAYIAPLLIVLAFMVLIGARYANIGYEVMHDASLSTAGNKFVTSARIINYLPLIVLFGGVLIIIALFAKPREASFGFT